MRIEADDKRLRYSGRIDWTDEKKPEFVYPCTSVAMRFTGEKLQVIAENRHSYWKNYLGCILDGEQSKFLLKDEEENIIDIPVPENGRTEHEVLIFKRQDSCHELIFEGFEIAKDAQIFQMEKAPERKIEVYGDSVSAGEVSEAVEYVGKEDPQHEGEYSNSWYSYAWMTARKLHAQIHDIAQGGIALLDHTGWFCEPEAVGMEMAWNKIHYNPAFEKRQDWEFKAYTPQVVIVAIGQNDNHPDDYMKEDYEGKRAVRWRKSYKAFLESLRTTYPDAQIICITTLLQHDASWDRAISWAVEEMKDDAITKYTFKRNGAATPGHLRIPEAEEMAEELAAYIENLQIKGWK